MTILDTLIAGGRDGLAVLDEAIVMQSNCRGLLPRPPKVDTRWHPDGCTCHACRRPRVIDSSRDAFRPTGTPPPFSWARLERHIEEGGVR